MISRRCFAVAIVFLLVALRCHASDDKPDPAGLIRSANETTDLSHVVPHRLTGSVILAPGGKDERRGTITIYRDRDQYRSDIEISGHRRTWLKLGNQVYVADSSPMAFLGLEKLKDIENAWREHRIDTREMKFSHESRKKKNGLDAWCMDEDTSGNSRLNLCFDAASQVLLSSAYPDDGYEFSDFKTLGDKKYPGEIRRFRRGKLVLEVLSLRAEAGALPEDAFQVPAGARKFETCEDMTFPKLISAPDLLSPRVVPAQSIRIFVYGIVTEDGSFTHTQVASVPRDPDILKSIKEKVEQRRYSPARCGTKPVATELYLEIDTERR